MKRSVLTTAAGLLVATAMTGCGPKFYKATGTVQSQGGQLGDWTSKPVGCSRDDLNGDSSQLMTFQFNPHTATGPDRAVNEHIPPGTPLQLHLVKNGPGVMGGLETISTGAGESFKLDTSDCKVIQLDYKGHAADFAGMPTYSGKLTLDCTVKGSHLTSDLKFDRCGQ